MTIIWLTHNSISFYWYQLRSYNRIYTFQSRILLVNCINFVEINNQSFPNKTSKFGELWSPAQQQLWPWSRSKVKVRTWCHLKGLVTRINFCKRTFAINKYFGYFIYWHQCFELLILFNICHCHRYTALSVREHWGQYILGGGGRLKVRQVIDWRKWMRFMND